MAQAPKARKMGVANVGGLQCCRERVSIELGVVARPWHSPHIEYSGNFIVLQQFDKYIDGAI